MADQVKIARALLSVSDKSGLIELGQVLARHGVELNADPDSTGLHQEAERIEVEK